MNTRRTLVSRLRSRVERYRLRFLARYASTITGVATAEPVVALTFDDGPDPVWTPRFLEVLEHYGARGTFFVIGENALRYPDIVSRAARAGHAIGNHSFSHRPLPLLSRRERRRDIRRCTAVLGQHNSGLFRPPFGEQDLATRIDLGWFGYRVITWSVIEPDWESFEPDRLAAAIEAKLRPGAIVLLHDSLHEFSKPEYADRSRSLQALELLLQHTTEAYRYVTVPELLESGQPQRRYWQQTRDAGFFTQYQAREPRAESGPPAAAPDPQGGSKPHTGTPTLG